VPKILSKSGDSLADIYDVEGSQAGINELVSQDVNLLHEMGSTIFSERIGGLIIAIPTNAQSQSTVVSVNFSQTSAHTRLIAMNVIAQPTGRLNRAQVSVTSPPGAPVGKSTDVPIWQWDSVGDSVEDIDVMVDAVILTDAVILRTEKPSILPLLLMGSDSPRPINTLSLRTSTAAFGAGTVITTMLLYFAFPQLGGISSRGLPIPSW